MKQGYIVIPAWMRGLGLDIWETVILSIIYGFSQDGETAFKGSWSYLQDAAMCSRDKVQKSLRRLSELGYILKTDLTAGGVKTCEYRANLSRFADVAKGGTSDVRVVRQSAKGGTSDVPNNIDNNINIKSCVLSRARGKFVKPSIEDVEMYCAERNNGINAAVFISFYESNGWKIGKNPMKDWRAAVRNWEARQRAERQAPRANGQPRRESTFEHNIRMIDEAEGTNYHRSMYGE